MFDRYEQEMKEYFGSPPEIEPADLVDELDAVLVRITREEAEATEILAQVIETNAFRRDGYSSPTAMLKHRNSMQANAAVQMVTRANGLIEAPLVASAYARAAITGPQVDALLNAKATAPEPFAHQEGELVQMALDTPMVRELRKKLDYWLQQVAELDQAMERDFVRETRVLRMRRDGDMIIINGWLDIEAGEIAMACLEPGPPAAEDDRSVAARRADNFVDICNGASNRPNLIVHVSADALFEGLPGISETGYGTFLTLGDVSRLACDSTVSRVVFGPESQPLDVGRSKRLVTPAMRTAIGARDLGCVFPGCDRPAHWCDVHHIVHWKDGGETAICNLVMLCRHHHTLIHDVGWTIRGEPGDLTFYRPDGTRLGETRKRQTPLAKAPEENPYALLDLIFKHHGIPARNRGSPWD